MTISLSTYNFHEQTLVGAIDSYMKELVHVRPFVADQHEALLESLANHWFADGGVNSIEAIQSEWLTTYLSVQAENQQIADVLRCFYAWAIDSRLIEQSPLDTVML